MWINTDGLLCLGQAVRASLSAIIQGSSQISVSDKTFAWTGDGFKPRWPKSPKKKKNVMENTYHVKENCAIFKFNLLRHAASKDFSK